ncbi:MAG: hypothetical protein IM600_12710 [Bacteroidetes bacterium]|nr:hypothetical protein [Bacteroidota bacterium]MCA6444284.1 hypothetical protein [Bacteroidota bacterium]
MKLITLYKLSGYVSILLGLAAAFSIYKIQYIKIGLPLCIAGFILAGINIFLNAKYFYDEEKIPKGYLGMFLSSVPVLFLLFVIGRH